jgi:hypothetical protein
MNLIKNTENLIDWNSVISDCQNSQGTVLTYSEKCFPDTEDFRSLDNMWKTAGYEYNTSSIEWINYFPGKNFDQSIVETFKNIVNVEPWMVWISRIRPGKMAPWHFDAHQNIAELLKLGKPMRYTCYIQEPSDGHISIVDQTAIYRPVKGSVYRWPSHDSWHCGMNGGLKDKFMFNYWGFI